VIIGWRYCDACPINPLIPHYLIVAGMVSSLLIILTGVAQWMTRTWARTIFDDTVNRNHPDRATMFVGCGVCSVMCINLSLVIFLFGWFITGWIWVLDVWQRVQYNRFEDKHYCHKILYRCSVAFLIITTFVHILFFCFIGRKACANVQMNDKKESISDDNS
jgi:hypothetical protein